LIRSSVDPHTIANDTAQKANWNSHLDSIVASERPRPLGKNACCGSPNPWRKNPVVPIRSPSLEPVPKAKAKPTAQ
jgi:hypothetical protein